jgi:adenylate kinase family enzyme
MPMLGAQDRLPARPHRVLVAGTSGAGKSTLARRIGETLGIAYTELDSLFHGPNWVPRPTFEVEVERFTAAPDWVCEWQYGSIRQLLADRADLLVWIDLPHRTVMRQVIFRTVRRRLRGEELWNGNVEGPLRTFFTDPDHIVRWAWNQHARTAEKVRSLQARRPELPIVRLRTRAEIERWCSGPLRYQPDGL